MAELIRIGGDALATVEERQMLAKQLALTCYRWFSDRHAGDIDPAAFSAKVEEYLFDLGATLMETKAACKRVARRSKFRPTAEEIEQEVVAIRSEVAEENRAQEHREKWRGAKEMQDEQGRDYLVPALNVDAMLAKGWKLPAEVMPRSVEDIRARMRELDKPMLSVVEDTSRQMAAIKEARRSKGN